MKKIAAWILVLVMMGFAAGCASMNMDPNLAYDKVYKENRGLAGGVGDNHPNCRQ